MRVLDRSRPYAESFDAETGRYTLEQGGCQFDRAGNFVSGETEGAGEEPAPDANAPDANAVAASDLNALHWRAVKAMVEMYGGTWTNKADGIAFLRGNG